MKSITIPAGVKRLSEVFCGCGDPDAAWESVRIELQRCSRIDQRPLPANTGTWYVLAYLLDYMDMTEHGGSVLGAWLTDDGRAVLDFLNRYSASWTALEGIEFVDDEAAAG